MQSELNIFLFSNFSFKVMDLLLLTLAILGVFTNYAVGERIDLWADDIPREVVPLIGGNETKFGEIKWIVTLKFGNKYDCGGGIISDRHILTAAHCFIDRENNFKLGKVKVVAGINNFNDKDQDRIEVDVEKVYVPETYNRLRVLPMFASDIAVVKLKESLNLNENENLGKLILPRKQDKFVDKPAIIAGFGWDSVSTVINGVPGRETGSTSGKLHSANVKVLSNEECQKYHDQEHRAIIYSYHMCGTMMKEKWERFYGACRGDSGSPLVYKNKVAIGIYCASQIGCDESQYPALYIRVSTFRDFIKSAMRDEDSDMRTHSY